MALPEDVRGPAESAVVEFCSDRSPQHLAHEVRIEHEVRGDVVTIVERRAPWMDGPDASWSRFEVAQLRYDRAARRWSLHWRKGDRWLRYMPDLAAPSVTALLAVIDADPDAVFWG